MGFRAIVIAMMAAVLCSCQSDFSERQDHLIGEKLRDLSGLTSDTGDDLKKVVIYDKTVQRIHEFHLQTMKVVKSVPAIVTGKDVDHTVLYSEIGKYIIDFAQGNLTIYDEDNQPNIDPVSLPGKPISAAFRPSLEWLVVYDDLMSVGILKLKPTGEVEKSWVGGPEIADGATISAGDIDSGGRLILALSNGHIAIADLDQSVDSQAWVKTTYDTGLTDIKWVGQVRGEASQVIAVSEGKVSLLDVDAQSVLDQKVISDGSVTKYSKSLDPHVVIKQGERLDMYYPEGGVLKSKTTYYQSVSLASSRLDIARDIWSIVDATGEGADWNQNSAEFGRKAKRWRLSDMLASPSVAIPNQTEYELAQSSVFVLYESRLGLAKFIDLDDGSYQRAEKFNLPYIGK